MCTSEALTDIATVLLTGIGVIIAAVGAWYAVREYRKEQRWKCHDIAAAQLEKLIAEPEINFTCQALDYGYAPLLIPDRYRELFADGSKEGNTAILHHDPQTFCLAAQSNLSEQIARNPTAMVYRYCFFRFLDYLNAIARQIESKQIIAEDVIELRYYLELLCNYRYAPAGADPRRVFTTTIRDWQYNKLLALAKLWNIPVPTS